MTSHVYTKETNKKKKKKTNKRYSVAISFVQKFNNLTIYVSSLTHDFEGRRLQ